MLFQWKIYVLSCCITNNNMSNSQKGQLKHIRSFLCSLWRTMSFLIFPWYITQIWPCYKLSSFEPSFARKRRERLIFCLVRLRQQIKIRELEIKNCSILLIQTLFLFGIAFCSNMLVKAIKGDLNLWMLRTFLSLSFSEVALLSLTAKKVLSIFAIPSTHFLDFCRSVMVADLVDSSIV